MLYGDWIGRWGRSYPKKEALVDVIDGRRYTYGQLADDVHRMAGFLASELDIKKGDRIAVLSSNRAEYITLFFAASRLGATLVPLNFRLAPEEFSVANGMLTPTLKLKRQVVQETYAAALDRLYDEALTHPTER